MNSPLRNGSSLFGISGGARSATAEAALLESAPASDASSALHSVREMMLGQGEAIMRCAERIDERFLAAVEVIAACHGRVVTCGMGKSGLVARKIASTLSSTGTPSFFLHPSEARHGDLGMVTPADVVLMISNSGETQELLALLAPLKSIGASLITIVGSLDSSLSRYCDVSLDAAVEREACPLNLAPTTSCLVALSIGDALAVTLGRTRGFAPQDFSRIHPRGNRGHQLRTRVRDVMRRKDLPTVQTSIPLSEVIVKMTAGRAGLAIVQDAEGRLQGVITDGDLRRALQRSPKPMSLTAEEVMTAEPATISVDASIREAEEMMRSRRIKALLAVCPAGKVRGVIDVFVNR